MAGESDEKAIHATAQAYVNAFNHSDVDAILALWSDDGDYVDATGKSFKAKGAIHEELESFFADYQGAAMEIVIDSIHFHSPELAIEDGRTEVLIDPDSAPIQRRYTVVHVKEGGKWLMQSVREGVVVPPSNYEHLEDLEWMVGNWVDQGEKGEIVYSSCKWSVNKNFLVRTYTAAFKGGSATHATQTIGWDPETKSIKSWTFDTNGGITEGLWSKDGDRWLCKTTTVLGGGERVTATETLTVVDENTHIWQAVDRKMDGQPLPDTEIVIIKRRL